MKKQFPISFIEVLVILLIVLFYISVVFSGHNHIRDRADRTKTLAAAKFLGLAMQQYAEDDIATNKMPYPIFDGKETLPWGDKNCTTRNVAELLCRAKYIRLQDMIAFKSAGITSKGYLPIMLKDDKKAKTEQFWPANSTCDFQLYCEPNLTNKKKERKVLVATFDGQSGEYKDAQFNGTGWVLFYANQTTEFVKRLNIKQFDMNKKSDPIYIKDAIAVTNNGGTLLSKIVSDAGGNMGSMLGGGSSELMGKTDLDKTYQALVR